MKIARIFLKPDGAKWVDQSILPAWNGAEVARVLQIENMLIATTHVIPADSVFAIYILDINENEPPNLHVVRPN